MRVDNNYYSIKNATQAVESEITVNKCSDTLYVEVTGTASALQMQVLGLADRAGTSWNRLCAINMADYSTNDNITAKGLYGFPISGVAEFKVKLLSVTGGNVTAFCRMVGGE